MSNIAFSYARFSSAGQAEGHSLKRQIERAIEYAAANDLVLDHALSFEDPALSGRTGEHIEKGELGLFLKAIALGKAPKGATLIVESFDRLSRQEPIDAVTILQQIITAGLTLVTLGTPGTPPKRFNRASIRGNPFQLHEALLDMHRAWSESEKKSDFITQSWIRRRKEAVESGKVMTSRTPHWIKAEGPPKNKTFSLVPERVAIVQRVLQMAKDGIGNHSIIKALNSEGVPPWSRSAKEDAKRAERGRVQVWEPSYIQKMLQHKALYGAVEIKGSIVIEGYYPPIITHDEFIHLQSLRKVRAKRSSARKESAAENNLFSGLVYCGYCGAQMIKNGYTKADGTQYKYLACHGARTGKTDCRMHGWKLSKFEGEVLAFLPEVDFSRVLGGANKVEAEQQRVAVLEQQVDDLKTKIERVYIAIEEGATGMVARVKKHEADLVRTERELRTAHDELAALTVHARLPSAEEYVALRVAMLKAKKDPAKLRPIREQLATMINQVVERLTLYPIGRGKQGDPSFDITFKSGIVREHTPEYVQFD